MLEAFATRRDRRRSFFFLAVCALLLGSAVVVTRTGFNPAGLRGLLAFLATCALVLAFTHAWKTPRKYVRLIYASAAGLAVCIVLSNVFEGLAASAGDSGLLHGTLGAAALVCFAGALLVCPAGVLVGVLGALATYRSESRPLLH
jgi:hypothetical protein